MNIERDMIDKIHKSLIGIMNCKDKLKVTRQAWRKEELVERVWMEVCRMVQFARIEFSRLMILQQIVCFLNLNKSTKKANSTLKTLLLRTMDHQTKMKWNSQVIRSNLVLQKEVAKLDRTSRIRNKWNNSRRYQYQNCKRHWTKWNLMLQLCMISLKLMKGRRPHK
jgi:hypothetical protein